MITVVANPQTVASRWSSNNWIAGTEALRKGPQPTVEPPVVNGDWQSLAAKKIYFYVDSNTAATSYFPGGSFGGSNT